MRPYYQKDGITIYHGDCREVLPHLRADVVIMDPPYGVKLGSRAINNRERASYDSIDDSPESVMAMIGEAWPLIRAAAPRVVVTPGVRNMWRYETPDHTGSFFYPSGAGCNAWGFSCWQPILFYGKDPFAGKGSRPDSFSSCEGAEKNGHPCPKPIGQWTWLVKRSSTDSDVILDPFVGSGTTLRVAKDLGRRAIGIEISERYCEIAANRLAQGVLEFA